MIGTLTFTVDGFPQSKGSWKVAGRKSNGAPRMLPDNDAETAWAEGVAWAARAARAALKAPPAPDAQRYAVSLTFTLIPPPNRGRTNRRDIDKLARSVLDALTGIVWRDDEQVDRLVLVKGIVGPETPKPGLLAVIAPLARQ